MSKNSVIELSGRDTTIDPLTELLRTGAQQLIHRAVEAELRELLAAHSQRRTEDGKEGVVRNGYLPAFEQHTGLGSVTVRISEVRAQSDEPVAFRSALVPPYVRKTKLLEAALPWPYLKGVFSGRDERSLKGVDRRGCRKLLSEVRIPLETSLDRCVSRLGRATPRQRPLGLCLYRWCLQRSEAAATKLCALMVIGVMRVDRSVFWRLRTVYANPSKAGAKCC